MKYLIYMSSARKLMDHDELLDILTVSRQNNKQRDVTGMLLYGEGTFVQVLEGDPRTVDEVYNVIKTDPRHRSIIQLSAGHQDERIFPDWSMGFKTINADVLSQFEGFKDVAQSDLLEREEKHPAIILLKTFTATNSLL